MPTWAEFGAAAPDLGYFGRRRLEGRVAYAACRAAAFDSARAVGYQPTERHVVFELNVERVLCTVYGERRTQKRWPARGPVP